MQATRDLLAKLRETLDRTREEACRENDRDGGLRAEAKYDEIVAVSGALAQVEIYFARTGNEAADVAKPSPVVGSSAWVGDKTAELWLRAALDAVREIQVRITERMDRYSDAGATLSVDAERLAKWELESAAERINNLRYRAAHGQSPTGEVTVCGKGLKP